MHTDVFKAHLPQRYTLKGKEKRGLGERRLNEYNEYADHETYLDDTTADRQQRVK